VSKHAFTESVLETTQVRNPWKAALRTAFAVIPALALLVQPVLEAVADGDADQLGGWAVGAVAVATAITRALAVPGVEQFLRDHIPWLAAAGTAQKV
jgi:hypothetical protein